MPKTRSIWSVLTAGLVAVGCRDALQVDNQNDPDRDRALATPADVEAFIGSAYAALHNGTIGGLTATGLNTTAQLQPQLMASGMESHSVLANFNMGPRGSIPRTPVSNQRGNPAEEENFRDYAFQHRAARIAAIGIARLNTPGFTLGTPARDARARAFARFVQGAALGNVALAYDKGSVITENDNPEAINPLVDYNAMRDAALAYLDSAVAIASGPAPSGSGWFPLPDAWINGNPLSAADLVRLARSYKARIRAGVARNPAERAAVNWNAVIADAENGITADLQISMNPSAGWNVSWVLQHFATGSANWHQTWQFMIGMADTSGGYDAYLATPAANRQPFLVVTPDRRFPQGTDRATQNANSPPTTTTTTFVAMMPYFRNRPSGEDQPGSPFGKSMYDFYRSRGFFNGARIGPYPVMTRAEIRLLAAEGYLRTPNVAQAAVLIDSSRVGKGQLPSLVTAGIADTLTPVPGVTACVPRVPDAAQNYQGTKCGNIWEALKWEYRMETAFAGYGMWFFAARGWGDLPEGTAVHWPVPFQEMDARREVFYDLGGVGQPGAAARGNYGLFAGGVY
jgi:hypothetical protein